MMRTLRFLLPFLLLCLVPASGRAAEPIALEGDYYFYTVSDGDGGHPTCRERWRFKPGGGLTIYSGQEVAAGRFRTEASGNDNWLVRETLTTNGLPDCYGSKSSNPEPGEERLFFYRARDDGIVLCTASGSDRSRILRIFGRLIRASDQPH
jgi:hypothetical protein